jgi:multiple sugar transport system permease protein
VEKNVAGRPVSLSETTSAPAATPPGVVPGTPALTQWRRERLWMTVLPYAMVLPVVLYEGLFIVYPIIQGVLASFTRTDPVMGTVALTTVGLTVASVVPSLAVGLLAAVILHYRFRGRWLVRSLIMLPWALPDLPALIVFNWMLDPIFGVMNFFARLLPGVHKNLQWLSDPNLARLAVIMIGTWKAYPFYCLVLLAALQGISEQLYEAARVDGASAFRCFLHVTWPSVLPTMVLLTLLAVIFSIKGFSLVYLLTGGGPDYATETLVLHIYNTGFRFFDYSYGETMGTAGLLGSMALAGLFFVVDRRIHAEGN